MTSDTQKAVAGVAALAGVAWLLSGTGGAQDIEDRLDEVAADAESVIDRFVAVSEGGEVGVDAATGVVYDDPEVGPENDERGDDTNVSFETVNTNNTRVDDVDPTSYAPDTIEGVDAPSTGVLADAGDSQTFGSAGEQANDDLSERAADSEMSDSMKAVFDRFANRDDL